jgi:hypothetical protein
LLFTDIVFPADWAQEAAGVTLTFESFDAAFSTDGTTFFLLGEDGTLASEEVYGDRAFDRSTEPLDDLCP